MHPSEFWWLWEAHKPVEMYGELTEYEVAELLSELDEHEHKQKATAP